MLLFGKLTDPQQGPATHGTPLLHRLVEQDKHQIEIGRRQVLARRPWSGTRTPARTLAICPPEYQHLNRAALPFFICFENKCQDDSKYTIRSTCVKPLLSALAQAAFYYFFHKSYKKLGFNSDQGILLLPPF
jgi:hypothetical protein